MKDKTLVAVSVVGYLVLVAGVAALIRFHAAIAVGPVAQGVQILGVALMIWARLTFRRRSFHVGANPTEGGLVTTGPYRFVRHPIYSAIVVMLAPAVATHPYWQSLVAGGVVLVGIAIRIAAEEHLVRQRYPEYADYAKRTRRLVPYVF